MGNKSTLLVVRSEVDDAVLLVFGVLLFSGSSGCLTAKQRLIKIFFGEFEWPFFKDFYSVY